MNIADCKNIWVYVETAEGKAKNVGLEMLNPAKELAAAKGEKVIAVLIGSNVMDAAKQTIAFGADEAIVIDAPQYKEFNTDAYTYALVSLVEKYSPSAVLIGGTPDGRDFAPRAAARLKTGCVTECFGLAIDAATGNITWTCPTFGGNILTDVVCADNRPQMGAIRSGAFKKLVPDNSRTGEIVAETVECPADVIKTKVVEAVKEISEAVNLEEADIIVSGGRGVGSAENFALLRELADLLGGVIGATRAPIESGWISRAHQIGQSGKCVSPKLYIACGISGATQHVSGITSSDYIVAINKDEDAPIFDVANCGIVGNLFDVIPVMIEEIKKAKA